MEKYNLNWVRLQVKHLMPTIDEINAWTPEQRGAYYIAEVCQALNITPDEVKMKYYERDRCVHLCFDDEIYDGYYEIRGGIWFETWDKYGRNWHGEKAMNMIQTAIRHIRTARRVVELEAKIKWLEANAVNILPMPIGEAIKDAWHY